MGAVDELLGKVEAEAVSTPADVRVEAGDTLACSVTASSMEMAKQFSQEQLRDSVALRDWLLTEARTSQDPKLISLASANGSMPPASRSTVPLWSSTRCIPSTRPSARCG